MLNFDELQKNFHKRADHRRFHSRLENPFIKQKELELFSFMGLESGKPELLLEIGCGEGSNKNYISLLNPHIRYVGLDFSYEKISFAETTFKNCFFVQASAIRLPFCSKTFDRILLRDVLHHVDQHREELIQGALEVLKPGGKLVVVEGNVQNVINRLFSLLIPAERGLKNSTPEKFKRLCEKFGCYRIEQTEPIFIVRSINYFLGWSNNPALKFVLGGLYYTGLVLEQVVALFTRKDKQAYMLAYFQTPAN